MARPHRHPAPEQEVCWEGFSKIAAIWRLRDLQANPISGLSLPLVPLDDPKSLYDQYLDVRKEHEAKMRNI